MPKARKRVAKWSELILWLVGAGCVGAYAMSAAQTATAQADAINSLESEWRDAAIDKPDTTLWSEKRVQQYDPSATAAMSPLGLLTIPGIDVRVAVFNGTSDEVLNLGAGRVPGTGHIGGEGNLAIAAHRDGFFRGLKDIEIGDEIHLQNANGVMRYAVTELSIVEPTDVSVLATTQTPTITLITCYPFYFVGSAPQRFIVRAALQAN